MQITSTPHNIKIMILVIIELNIICTSLELFKVGVQDLATESNYFWILPFIYLYSVTYELV